MALTTTDSITLDVHNNVIQTINVKQYDKDSRKINITVIDSHKTDSVKKIDLSPYTLYFKEMTAGNRPIYSESDIVTNNDGTATLTLTDAMLYDSGRAKCEILIRDMNTQAVLSTMIFYLNVIGSVYSDSEVVGDTTVSTLMHMIDILEDSEDTVATELANLDNLKTQVSQLRNEVTSWQTAETARVNNENTRVSNETNRNQRFDNKMSEVDSTITTKMNHVDSVLAGKVSDINTKLGQVDTTINTKINAVDAKLTQVDNTLTQGLSDMEDAVDAKLDGVDTKLSDVDTALAQKLSDIDDEVSIRTTALDDLQQDYTDFMTEVNGQRTLIDSVAKEGAEALERIREINGDITVLHTGDVATSNEVSAILVDGEIFPAQYTWS